MVVPYWEWDQVRGDEAAEVEYLRGKLASGVVEEPAAASRSQAAEVDDSCAAAASSASRREARDDVEPGVEEPEEQRASGDVRKECSICSETNPESCFSRKQLAARAHSRKCSQCAGTARCSGGTPVPIPAAQVTAARAPDHACMSVEGSCRSAAGASAGLVCALLAAAVAAVSILLSSVWG